MRAATRLERVHRTIRRRIKFFRECVDRSKVGRSRTENSWRALVVMELDNLIVSSLREFLVSTNFGTRGLSGRSIATTVPPFASDAHLAAEVLSVLNSTKWTRLGSPSEISRRYEYKIRSPRDCRTVLAQLGGSNLPEFDVALSLNSPLFDDIAVVRNFFAHRNRDTWASVRNHFSTTRGFPTFSSAVELLAYRRVGSSEELLDEWLLDAELFFDYAFQ